MEPADMADLGTRNPDRRIDQKQQARAESGRQADLPQLLREQGPQEEKQQTGI